MKSLEETINLQRQASLPEKSSWVFASAGSGKTTILTNRVLRLLLSGVNPEKILCLTFTNVATSEMQERINHRLSNWLVFNQDELEDDLRKLTGECPDKKMISNAKGLLIKTLEEEQKVKIQTIHSFCQNIIKSFPFEAGINPNFKVIDKYNESILLTKAKEKLFQEAGNDESIKNFLTTINSKINEDSLDELLRLILAKKENIINLTEKFFGINNVVKYIYSLFDLDETDSKEVLVKDFNEMLAKNNLLKLKNALQNSSSKKNQSIADIIDQYHGQETENHIDLISSAFFTEKGDPRAIYGDVKANELLSFIYQNLQSLIKKSRERFLAYELCQNTQYLVIIANKIIQHYQNFKKLGNFLDYNDLIFLGSRLVNHSNFSDWVKMKIDSTFDHILVDESQDTNHLQWDIIKALTEDFYSGFSSNNNNRSIFIVGDEKQSIYSFQGANPAISKEIFNFFKEKEPLKLQDIKLNSSFRSGAKILKAVDTVFNCNQFLKSVSKIADEISHNPIKTISGKVEIWPPIVANPDQIDQSPWLLDFEIDNKLEETSQQILAKTIGNKILADISNSRSLEGQNSKITFGDYMILLRNRTNGLDKAITEFFTKNNIPFTSQSKIKFSSSLALQDLISLAKFCLLPDDDLNICCLLKSPFFNLDEGRLIKICKIKNESSEKKSIYQILFELHEYQEYAIQLKKIFDFSHQLKPFDLYFLLLHQKNYRQSFLKYYGSMAISIIEGFLSIIQNYNLTGSQNLQKLLEFIENTDPEISIESSVQEDAVRISTIHSAKGSQAPIVILADCCYNFNQQKVTKEPILWLENQQINLPLWINKNSKSIDQLKDYQHTKNQEAFDESLRLLYVAMTRAENELYIAGYGSANDENCWHNIISRRLGESFINLDIEQYQKSVIRSKCNVENNDDLIANDLIIPDINLKDKEIDENFEQIRGKIIHKILEIFAKSPIKEANWLQDLAKKEVKQNNNLSYQEKLKISDEINLFIQSTYFNELFSKNTKSEVEITFNNEIKRIDLLIEDKDQITVIDFKSQQIMPEKIPDNFISQLLDYKLAIKNLYPKKQIRCAIFWTSFLKLDYLD